MIKLATVFSGIGAIEHALQRMNLDHEIVFACDNGDIDILSKKIDNNLIDIDIEINELTKQIEDIFKDNTNDIEYTEELEKNLEKVKSEYTDLNKRIEISDDLIHLTKEVIEKALVQDYLNKPTENIYKQWIDCYSKKSDLPLTIADKADAMQKIVKIESDFKRFLSKEFKPEYLLTERDQISKYREIIDIPEFKKIIKTLRSITYSLSMLHEKINTSFILKELKKIDDYDKKKEYVDNLYKSNENKNQVKKAYFANYDIDESRYHWNASFLDGTQYRNKVDLFVGGSPCQSFSLVGKQRGLADTRGTLFYEYARLVCEIQPKVFIYENVKAILSNDDGNTWKTMTQVFDDLGYDWYASTLNSRDYGVPQNRERVFVVGFKNDLEKCPFNFPKPVELTSKMQDYLLDNVSGKYYLPSKGVEFVTSEKNIEKRYTQIDGQIQLCQKRNQQFNWHGDFVFVEENTDMEKTIEDLDKYFLSKKVARYVLSAGTKGFYSKPKIDLCVARPLLTTMHKMHRAGVDNYVTTVGRIRKLTPRECLRLMGFCDSFKIVVSDTAAYQQAGNSIVVDVLIAIMDSILNSYNLIEKYEE